MKFSAGSHIGQIWTFLLQALEPHVPQLNAITKIQLHVESLNGPTMEMASGIHLEPHLYLHDA